MTIEKYEKKSIFIKKILSNTREIFSGITKSAEKPLEGRPVTFSLPDCLMSGLALFALKFPSLLKFEKDSKNISIKNNLKILYGIDTVPSDTQMRKRLDDVDFKELRKPFKKIFSILQRGKILESYQYLDGNYLLAIDGTGHYSSHTVSCENCCIKQHKDGSVTYYHQLLGASIVYPGNPIVIPLAPEPIIKTDGNNKNDCERNASKRFLADVKREHPHLKLIILEDSLASNGPHLKELQSLDMRYIIGAKEGDHSLLFSWVNASDEVQALEYQDIKGTTHKFRFLNSVPLNDANFDFKVNFLEYWQIDSKRKVTHFSWVTDLFLTKENVDKIMKAGRTRWKIENETFNTLKNQGYNFEHNFGHGEKNLCSVFAMLMMLSFLIDQAQELVVTTK